LDNLTSLRGVNEIKDQQVVLFQTKPAIRNMMGAQSETNGPEYLRTGAKLDFYLAEKQDELRLELINEKGQLVRTFKANTPKKETVDTTRNMSTEFSEAPASGGLPNNAGMNHFSWNLRHQGGWDKDPKRAYTGNGPMVSTGKYTARLIAGETVLEEKFDVLLDPRMTLVTDADVAEQEALNLEIQTFRDELAQLIEAVEKEQEALKLLIEKENNTKKIARTKSELDAIHQELVTPDGTYMQPMLEDQARYLNSMMGQADQKPGKDAYERFAELKQQFGEIKARFEGMK
jgi:hypothetical protein